MKKEKYDGIAFDIIMGMPSVGGVKVQPQTRKKKKRSQRKTEGSPTLMVGGGFRHLKVVNGAVPTCFADVVDALL